MKFLFVQTKYSYVSPKPRQGHSNLINLFVFTKEIKRRRKEKKYLNPNSQFFTDRTQNRSRIVSSISFRSYGVVLVLCYSDQPWLLQGPRVCLGENLRLLLLLHRQCRRGLSTGREFRRRIPICLSGSVIGSSPCFSLWPLVSSLLRSFFFSVSILTMAPRRLPLLRPPRALRFESVNLFNVLCLCLH